MVVCWQKSEFGFLKLNTDGSFDKDNGRAGLGGALRDEKGATDHGFFHPIPLHQSQHCRSKGSLVWWKLVQTKWIHTNLIIELDSMVITNMLKNKKVGSFRINRIIEETSEMLKQATIRFTHCYREANQLTDWLVKMAMDSHDSSIYLSANELPNGAKG
ncbi:hypothetical protein KY285_011207 [Solanum tuberosum]|nr:hypothetical protein KY289_012865 [Solanum tuberosum]KAH0735500.1 hypothetical protein KY285_011207 [Solanum tuberosum]